MEKIKNIDGKMVAEKIKATIKTQIEELQKLGASVPTLACMIVGNNPASEKYVASKEKTCQELGMGSKVIRLDDNTPQESIIYTIEKLNRDENISGILLQLPLPYGYDERTIINAIDPKKDVDCLTDINLGKLMGKTQDIAPCTAQGIMTLLDEYNIDIEGKNVVVIGRSLLVGKSVANLLEQRNATVTICHSKTKNMQEITKQADILVVAIGRPKFITPDYVKDDAVVIDVGINRVEVEKMQDGKTVKKERTVGDVDYETVAQKCSYITPVPGGVGPMTVAELMRNTYTLYTLSNDVILTKSKEDEK